MGYKASNNADTTLSESITQTSTTIAVATGHGDDFPALGATDWTLITITDKNGAREIIKIIARTGDTMTVGTTPGGEADVGGRAQEGTAALSITYTDDHSVRCCPTAGLIEAMADYSDQGDLTATPAEIEAVCKGNTATAAELSQLHGSGVVKADLEKLHAAELSQLHGSGVVKADLVKLHAMTLSAVEANLLDADTRKIGDILTKTSGSTMGAITAVAVGNYLKSAGVGAIPQWGKLSLSDTGTKIGFVSTTSSGGAPVVVTGIGFKPSVVIFLSTVVHNDYASFTIGLDNGTSRAYAGFWMEESSFSEGYTTRVHVSYNNNYSIYGVFDGASAVRGYISSMGSDGFTITKASSPVTGPSVFYLALP